MLEALLFVDLNGKTDTDACNRPVCLSTGQCFLVMLLAFHMELSRGKDLAVLSSNREAL